MKPFRNILVIQTAFLGDVILTLPLVQACKKLFPDAAIDILVIPAARDLGSHHPDIRETLVFDKRGADRGIAGVIRIARSLQSRSYDLALIPHRSLRSAVVAALARIPTRIGFDRSSGRMLFSTSVHYDGKLHEIDRNLALLKPVAEEPVSRELPRLYPSDDDERKVDRLLVEVEVGHVDKLVAIAPGSIWNTKRWLKERFASLAVNLDEAGLEIVLIGGNDDRDLCEEVRTLSGSSHVYNTAGMLRLLQSTALLRRCKILVSNDSAPMHMAGAVGTPVVGIFGATVPAFGFGPSGPWDVVVETDGLKCRPCSIHGGNQCPIKTFECMKNISHERVFRTVAEVLVKASNAGKY